MHSNRLTAEHLTQIRQHTDWRRLFGALQIEKDVKKSRDNDWWGKSPFRPTERNASFHVNDHGWYCHSTGRGGGPIELLQQLYPEMSCYDAGRWLLERGVSQIVATAREDVQAMTDDSRPHQEPEAGNQPIRQDLRKQLSTDHPAFAVRGIPSQVPEELGAGYLDRPPRKKGRPDPINRRLVFQIRGLREGDDGYMRPIILSHTGRATTPEQESRDGKWWTYGGFKKTLEVYNIDHMILDSAAVTQARESDFVLVVEGPFDVAKLYAAGIRNVVATFGAHLSVAQLRRLDLIAEMTGVDRFLFFYDRDDAGLQGAARATRAIADADLDLEAEVFDWDQTWRSPRRGEVAIPPSISDPCEFTVEQLQWLRREGCI